MIKLTQKKTKLKAGTMRCILGKWRVPCQKNHKFIKTLR